MPSQGQARGGIIFRVGVADEPFTHRGFTHLIEHLALSGFDVPYEYNGFVDATTTNFFAQGSPEELGRFITDSTTALANLPYERLETEVRILLAEAECNGTSPVMDALASI